MKKTNLIITLLIIFFLVSGITALISAFLHRPHQISSVYADVTIVPTTLLGFNVDTEALHFGKIPQSGVGKKTIVLTNDNDFSVNVKVFATGNISQFIRTSEEVFVLEPGHAKNYTVWLDGQNGPVGYYEGHVTFALYKTRHSFSAFFFSNRQTVST